MENTTGDVVGDVLWGYVRGPRGETWGLNFGGSPGEVATGDGVGGDLGGSTEGRW